MKTRLLNLWEHLRSSYWFVPTLMALGAVGLAILTLYIDRGFIPAPEGISWWMYSGGAEGARSVLATVASSIITVAGVVFSITMVAITQASSQFGPRLLRNFMRDAGNQIVLGTFIATFLYSLIVLRTVYGTEDGSAVPHLSVSTAVLLATASTGVLIYFIHHVSLMIQAPQVAARVGDDFVRSICALFPDCPPASNHPPRPQGRPDAELNIPPALRILHVRSSTSGYLQALSRDGLVERAGRVNAVIRLLAGPGQFVIADQPLAEVHLLKGVDDPSAVMDEFRECLIIGDQRTPEQDIEYSMRQLVEVAVRALSPGINDPFTAANCIDWLTSGLCRAAVCDFPSPYRLDGEGRLRLIVRGTDFQSLLQGAMNEIRQYGAGSVTVTVHLLEALATIASVSASTEACEAVRAQALLIRAQARRREFEPADQQVVEDRFARVEAVLCSGVAPASDRGDGGFASLPSPGTEPSKRFGPRN